MASKEETPVLNFLRGASLVTFPFAFALSIAHAATASDALFPAISLVPQSASTVFSGCVLYFNKYRKVHQHIELDDGSENRRRRIRNAATFVADAALAGGLLTCMVFSWTSLDSGYTYQRYWNYNNPAETMLGTYATVPFMINMTIHLFFALRAICLSLPKDWIDAFRPAPATCPHCHHDLGSRSTVAEGTDPVWLTSKSGVRYSLLNPEENDSLYRDVERQVGKPGSDDDAERGEGVRKASEETAREINVTDVAKIVDV